MWLTQLLMSQWRQRPGRTFFSIFSIAIAVAAVLGTMLAQSSVRRGYQVLSQAVEGPPALDIVSLSGGRFPIADVPVLDDEAISAAVPLLSRTTSARVSGQRFKSIILGLPTGIREVADVVEICEGELCRQPGQAVIVRELADELGIRVGDRLLYLGRSGPRSADIVGLATGISGGRLVPGATLVMPLNEVQGAFRLGGQADRIRLLIEAGDNQARIQQEVADLLPSTLHVQTPVGQIELADSLLKSTELALDFAGALSMTMAGFLVLNALRMNLGERRAAMATVRVLGATSRQVFLLHLLEGMLLGSAGALLGIPLGTFLARGLAQAMQRLVGGDIAAAGSSPWPWVIALVAGPLVALIAAVIPAFQSRGISPMEALGESELRRSDRVPRWPGVAGLVAWGISAYLICEVVYERLPPGFALPGGLLMLVAFIMMIPVLIAPSVRAAGLLVSPARRVEAFLASEQVLRRRTRSALTVGILVVVLSNGLGLGNAVINNVDDVRQWYRRNMAGDWFVIDPLASGPLAGAMDRSEIPASLKEIAGVHQVVPIYYMASRANGVPATCVVRSFPGDVQLPWTLPHSEIDDVRQRLARGELIASSVLARRLSVDVGASVRVDFQGRVQSFRVGAKVNDYTMGGMVVYLAEKPARELVNLTAPNMYIIHAAPDANREQLRARVEEISQEQQVICRSFDDMRKGLDRLINGIVGALWGLIGIGFVVGGVAVANTLTMSVLEQTRELGLMRIIGMTRWQVRRLVLWEAILLALVSIALGTLAGVTTAGVIHLCTLPLLGRSMPFTFHWWLLVANLAGCGVVAFVAAWSPSERTARINLLEAIAQE